MKDRHVKSRAKIRIKTAYASTKKDGVWNMQRRAYWNGLYDIKIIWRVVFVKRGVNFDIKWNCGSLLVATPRPT